MPPTPEQLAAYERDLDENGYCLVPGTLDPARLRELRDTLVRVAAEEIRLPRNAQRF